MTLPFFDEVAGAKSVLIAGAGGGFDVFSGLPIYFGLRAAGKRAFLANLTFSNIPPRAGRRVTPDCVEVTADSDGSKSYFPEKHLARWFRLRDEEVSIYCIERVGAAPVRRAYQALVQELGVDAVVLVDGGTDSLMRGDEDGLGTPEEDVASIAAVAALDVPVKVLACLGFGIDAFHGVSHAHVLEAVAELAADGAYLGAWSLLEPMPEVRLFRDATHYVLRETPDRPSIVCTSILSALEGRFGNHQVTDRTAGSELFINPLMSLYWTFRLDAVARRVMYLDRIGNTETYDGLARAIAAFRAGLPAQRRHRDLPI